jgi:hypothetical protein
MGRVMKGYSEIDALAIGNDHVALWQCAWRIVRHVVFPGQSRQNVTRTSLGKCSRRL